MSEAIQETAQDKLKKRQSILDDYETKKIGLPIHKPPGETSEYEEYFSMDRKEIESLTPEKATSISVRLAQLSLYLTRSINRERTNILWAEGELNKIVSSQIGQHDPYMKHELKIAAICKTNSAAKELSSIVRYANERTVRLEGMADSVRNLSYVIGMMRKVKNDFSRQTAHA